jgi:hypothetical protein
MRGSFLHDDHEEHDAHPDRHEGAKLTKVVHQDACDETRVCGPAEPSARSKAAGSAGRPPTPFSRTHRAQLSVLQSTAVD